MKPRLSLKHHLTLTYILLAVVVAGAFSLVSYISIKIIEDKIVDAPRGLEETELVILLSLAVGFVVSVVLAAGLSVWSVRRVIAPVAALADAVNRNAAATELPSRFAQDEIGVLARAFAKRTDELQQFLQREQMFTADVSHELRTPLTVILGAAEVLTVQLPAQSAQYTSAERIRRIAAETAQRISALLLLARADSASQAPYTELNTVVESELEHCQPLLYGKAVQCKLQWQAPVFARVHTELAGIVIGNLLRNACRHTEQGYILVQLGAGQLVIEDSGVGISAAVHARLFQRFVHGNDSPAHEGMGLGLSIVKRVVEHIGWDIQVETPPAGGTRFVLNFPPR
ncbi:signal transduction histidine kinase [Rheinheimera pacifica]|uniref:sensor histidine kinase n=1 Tax=Rheinheimera pacifica TaxID=173990 RepID=UPI00285A76EB|nr:HAMP domain-containing sensor histidine kinase [Rheinheimera pacifica]MDR6982926.1 signal transduction histidine kinase [Rheinheimera pacifica]